MLHPSFFVLHSSFYEILPDCRRSLGRPPCVAPDGGLASRRPAGGVPLLWGRPDGCRGRLRACEALSRPGLHGLRSRPAPPAHHLCQHGLLQARHCGVAARRLDSGGLPRLQPQHREIHPCPHAHPRLLLHRPQDMGVEGVSHQEHQARRGRALLHPAVRGRLLRGEASLSHPLRGQSDTGRGGGLPRCLQGDSTGLLRTQRPASQARHRLAGRQPQAGNQGQPARHDTGGFLLRRLSAGAGRCAWH